MGWSLTPHVKIRIHLDEQRVAISQLKDRAAPAWSFDFCSGSGQPAFRLHGYLSMTGLHTRLTFGIPRLLGVGFVLCLVLVGVCSGAHSKAKSKAKARPVVRLHAVVAHSRLLPAVASQVSVAPMAKTVAQSQHAAMGPKPLPPPPPPVIRGGPWTEPTFADSTEGDNVDGEDLDVRRAAVAALGPYNGSVVVVDSANGRVLSMVNQRV
jgi:hypothetical protein